jgi:hypothetical protein
LGYALWNDPRLDVSSEVELNVSILTTLIVAVSACIFNEVATADACTVNNKDA